MKGKTKDQNQRNIFRPILKEIINPEHELVVLAHKISWQYFENQFESLFSHTGRPSIPIRTMVGLLLLKQMYNLGDETVIEQWLQNPYFQYFTGESEFQWKAPCDPSDLVHFRNRIGKEGAENIFQSSVDTRKDEIKGNDVIFDTTAQEKNITYPTDAKLLRRVIDNCNKIAEQEGIEQRQNYKRTVKTLLLKQRFAHHPKRKKEAKAALRKMRTIAGRLTRELERNLTADLLEEYQEQLKIFYQIINQKRSDKNKIYSIHEPDVSCIAKGKAHKKFEYGSKVSFAMLPGSNIIVGTVNFQGNPHGSKTLQTTLDHCQKITGKTFERAIFDRGYRGRKKMRDTSLLVSGAARGKTPYEKQKYRKKFRSRAAIEPVIGHLNHDHKMIRNYLKGTFGDEINALMAATAFNLKIWMREMEKNVLLLKIFLCHFLFNSSFYQIYTLQN